MSIKSDGMHRFFKTSDVARYCGVTNEGVLNWIKSGKLAAFPTQGGHYRVRLEDFREFLDAYRIPVDESFFHDPPSSGSGADDEAEIR